MTEKLNKQNTLSRKKTNSKFIHHISTWCYIPEDTSLYSATRISNLTFLYSDWDTQHPWLQDLCTL